ncbi:MAG: ABC transporter ATP-binding protein [Actinobacteria bacterium]|nr:ABC transporter ATP-binding protein [Actinomycetota bacterium]
MEDGEFFSLIGPSGCGKTTTLRMIAGLDRPTSGTVEVFGQDVTEAPAYRRPVNTVFQNYALFPHLSIFENVAFGLKEHRVSRREIGPKVANMLELVHLTGREADKPAQLSGGQQQRVALARALVLEPKVLLLDEPLGALDLKLRKSMQRLLREIQREVGITFIYVTHDQEEAFSMSTRVGVMNGGILEQVGPPKEVYRRPASRFVADFVGASNHVAVTILETGRPGTYVVRSTEGEVTCLAAGPPGLASGAAAEMIVRPEGIVRGELEDSACSLSGRVAETSYSGPHTELTIEGTPLGALRTAERGDESTDVRTGETVTVSWSVGASWLVPEDAPAASPVEPDGSHVAA